MIADIPAIRRAVPDGVPLIEDAAQALGAVHGGMKIGHDSHAGVFSLGPGKPATAGELGFFVTASQRLFAAAVGASQHPVRQLLTGIDDPDVEIVMTRVAPAAALLAAWKQHCWLEALPALKTATRTVATLLERAGAQLLGGHANRHGSADRVAILLGSEGEEGIREALSAEPAPGHTVLVVPSGARPDPRLGPAERSELDGLLRRVRIVMLRANRTTLS